MTGRPTGVPGAIWDHERRYRSSELMTRFGNFSVAVCGAGALGGNILEGLARGGFRSLRVVDRDRVEERNLSTQPYERADVGALKVHALANAIYRAVGVEVDARSEELTAANAAKHLARSDLVIDTLDNSAGRRVVKETSEAIGIPCLHVGLATGYAEALWSENYRVPSAAQDDVCDYPLARTLVMITAAVACELAVGFVARGERRGVTITLGDLAIRPFGA